MKAIIEENPINPEATDLALISEERAPTAVSFCHQNPNKTEKK